MEPAAPWYLQVPPADFQVFAPDSFLFRPNVRNRTVLLDTNLLFHI